MLFGIALITIPRMQYNLEAYQQKTAEPIKPSFQQVVSSHQSAIPLQIVIPAVGIDIPITQSALKNGYWETSETTASFGLGSSLPGEGSNIVVFAHAREGLFLPLRNIKEKQTIYLFTREQYIPYVVESIIEVKPTDTYVVKPTEREQLTLFTCSGFLDSKRLVVIATPV